MKRFLHAWGPPLALAAAIFALSAQPTLIATPDVPEFDKIAHLVVYGVLGALLARGGALWPVATVWLVALGVAYGASDEIHQMFVPGRSPELADWAADAIGVAAGVYLYILWHARRRRAPAAAAAEAIS